MQTSTLVACLWPGLPRLWWRGDWRALLIAVFFAVGVNFALLTSFVWPEMLAPGVRALGWCGLIGGWIAAAWLGLRQTATLRGAASGAAQQDLFVQAQAEYLKGHWLEAESLLRRLIQRDERDTAAALMLAALLRRTGRQAAAADRLDGLERMDGGAGWSLEIARERLLLKRPGENRPDEKQNEVVGDSPDSRAQQSDRQKGNSCTRDLRTARGK